MTADDRETLKDDVQLLRDWADTISRHFADERVRHHLNRIADRIDALAARQTPEGSVRVRIAVAVSRDGGVMIQHVGRRGDAEALAYLRQFADEPESRISFVEADVPQPAAVEGSVVE